MLSLQEYASGSGTSGSSDSDGASSDTEPTAGTSKATKTKEELPDHLKPLPKDSEHSVASQMQIVAAPDVVVNVSS